MSDTQTWYMTTQTWYMTSGFDIHAVEVKRSTDKSVWVREKNWLSDGFQVRCHPRRSTYENYFPTKQEAVDYARSRLEQKVVSARAGLEVAQKVLDKFNAEHEMGA